MEKRKPSWGEVTKWEATAVIFRTGGTNNQGKRALRTDMADRGLASIHRGRERGEAVVSVREGPAGGQRDRAGRGGG
ncbi:hypothetical protein AAFF_G00360130 [Aldrovandia affinis]|uniref:Uncharacterized protein n=1 Tax=Aldrovandia affinis TaxID=143900 RepID=A0AAD7SI88_9TELE|nr:hypothetical protein AAFF_G00360130 [Aldrovandia affinis]